MNPILHEISQGEKDKYCMISLKYGILVNLTKVQSKMNTSSVNKHVWRGWKDGYLKRTLPVLPQAPHLRGGEHHLQPRSRVSYALFWSLWVLNICDAHIYTQGNTHIK